MNSTHILLCGALCVGSLASARADLDPADIAKAARVIQDITELTQQIQAYAPGTPIAGPEPRHDAEGDYISPYRSDGTLTDWARKGIGSAAGAAVGNLIGDEIGDRAAGALASKVPGGAMLGGLFGRAAKKKAQETAAVLAVGGWDYIKETSDLSFDSASDLAVYLHLNHAGVDPDFALAVSAAMGVYPRLVGAYEPAVERAYGYEVVDNVRAASAAGRPPVNATGEVGDEAMAAGLLGAVVDANTLDSTGGGEGLPAVEATVTDLASLPALDPIKLDPKKDFVTRVRPLTRSNRVVVAGFRVGFIIEDSVTASVAAGYQFGGTHTSGSRSKTAVQLSAWTMPCCSKSRNRCIRTSWPI